MGHCLPLPSREARNRAERAHSEFLVPRSSFLSSLFRRAPEADRGRANHFAAFPIYDQFRVAVAIISELNKALADLSNGMAAAKRLVLSRTETRIDHDGKIRGSYEPEPARQMAVVHEGSAA